MFLYNKKFFTDIKLVLTLFFCVIVIIFPLFLDINVLYLSERKKMFIGVYLFGFIKIIGGYVQKINEGFSFHVSEKKAFIFSYKNLFGAKEKIKPFMDYHFIKIKTVTETGILTDAEKKLPCIFAASYANEFLLWFFSLKKPYLVIDNSFNVYTEKDLFNFYAKINFVFNLLMVISSVVKILTEKTIYAIRKRKNEN